MKKIWIEIKEHWLFIIFTAWCMLIIIGLYVDNKKIHNATPVEEISNIDSLKQINEHIELEITKLDSIKYEEIKKLDSLSNDDAVKLLWSLLSEYDSSFYGRGRFYNNIY